MAANTVGAVRRIDRPDAVILRVDRSRRALWAAVRLTFVTLLCLATVALGIHLGAGDIRQTEWWSVLWCFAAVVLLWWYVARYIPPLWRTGRRRVAITIDARGRRLEIDAGVDDDAAKRAWPADAVEDVVIASRPGGAGELHIVPLVGRDARLFYGLPQDELEFIAATIRDALRLTARDAALDDDVEATADDAPAEHMSGGATPIERPLALDYAPTPPEGIVIDRGHSGLTIYVAPMPVTTFLAKRGAILAAVLAAFVIWGLATGTRRETVLLYSVLALLVALANAGPCLTRSTIQMSRTRVSRQDVTPFGTVDERWAVRSVRDVFVTARPPTVELRLADGETAVLASPASAGEAEAIAAALRRGLRTYTRERDAAAAAAV